MRKINTSDVFKMARIIKAAGAKEIIAEFFEEGKNKPVVNEKEDMSEQQEKMGFEVFMAIFEVCSTEKIEKMLYELIGGITEKEPDVIASQPLEIMVADIKTIVAKNNIAAFFKQAGQLMK